MKQLTPENRVSWIYKTTIAAMLAGLALSYKLWLSDRLFPAAPLADELPFSWSNYLFATLILLLVTGLFLKNVRLLTTAFLLIIVLMLLQDQNRIQAWVYLYALILAPFTFTKKVKYTSLPMYFQTLLIGVYFWSGIHKLNSSFNEVIFSSMLTSLLNVSESMAIELLPLGYSIGLLEVLAATLLFFKRTRQIGLYLVIFSHVFVMIYISPLGINDNSVIYPWNAAMIILAFLLFNKSRESFSIAAFSGNKKLLLAVTFAWLLPILNFFGYWDSYLSFSLYSGKDDQYFIAIDNSALNKLDPQIHQFFTPATGVEGGRIIHLNDWSMKELNTPIYPEQRVFKQIAKQFCSLGIENQQLYFLAIDPRQNYKRFTCSDLQ